MALQRIVVFLFLYFKVNKLFRLGPTAMTHEEWMLSQSLFNKHTHTNTH